MNKLAKDKTMTVKEIAEMLGVSTDLIKKRIREAYPDKMKNGITTRLNEMEVTLIKLRISQNSSIATYDDRHRLANMPKTQLEEELLIQQAMSIQANRVLRLQEENDQLKQDKLLNAPKVELAETCLRTTQEMSITDAGKHLKISQSAIFKIMRKHHYLTLKNLPTQKALNRNLLTVKTGNKDGKNWTRAYMNMENIMNFQKRHLKPIPVQGNLLEVSNE